MTQTTTMNNKNLSKKSNLLLQKNTKQQTDIEDTEKKATDIEDSKDSENEWEEEEAVCKRCIFMFI